MKSNDIKCGSTGVRVSHPAVAMGALCCHLYYYRWPDSPHIQVGHTPDDETFLAYTL